MGAANTSPTQEARPRRHTLPAAPAVPAIPAAGPTSLRAVSGSPPNTKCGVGRSCTRISALRSSSALPALSTNGTPAQLQGRAAGQCEQSWSQGSQAAADNDRVKPLYNNASACRSRETVQRLNTGDITKPAAPVVVDEERHCRKSGRLAARWHRGVVCAEGGRRT